MDLIDIIWILVFVAIAVKLFGVGMVAILLTVFFVLAGGI